MKIEYILVFRSEGIPIYSHCFGMFCASAGADDTLLSGFLSALTSMPQMFGKPEESMQSVEMDYTKLLFSKTDNDIIIVIGVDREMYTDENRETLEDVFDEIEQLLDEFSDVNWNAATDDERYEFEHRLVDDVLPSTLDIFVDYCRAGEDCMFDHQTSYDEDSGLTDDMTIWERLRTRYEENSYPGFIDFIFRQIGKLVMWLDRRNYRKRRKKLKESTT